MSIVHRAGDVVGTPAWQLDRIYETETAEMLEQYYGQDDFPVSQVESKFSQARYLIGQAVVQLCNAASVADPYGKAKPIDDLISELDDDFCFKMSKVLDKLKEGA